MKVHVQLFGAAQVDVGIKRECFDLPPLSTVGDLVAVLEHTYPRLKGFIKGKEHSLSCLILVNGSDLKKMENLETPLTDGDIIDIISMISGG